MASRRSRVNNTVSSRINSLTQDLANTKKKTILTADQVQAANLDTDSVTQDALAPNSVGNDQIIPGAVGTNELGVVNALNSDSNLPINLPGHVQLVGASYPPPAVGTSGLSIDSSGNIVIASGGSGSSITFSDTAPVGPSGGAQWFCTLDGTLYIYYVDVNSGQWVEYGIESTEPNSIPAGSILSWAGTTAPSNFFICDGTAVSRATYASLFSAIGTAWGVGDGSTTFNLPDLRGQTLAGYKSGDANFGTFAAKVGEAAHMLTAQEIPPHAHQPGPTGEAGAGSPAGTSDNPIRGSTSVDANFRTGSALFTSGTYGSASVGSQTAHNNVQPTATVNFIIKFSASEAPGDSALATRVGVVEQEHFNRIINGNFRINQRAYNSGFLNPGVYGFDRWCAGGLTNLLVNPSAETNVTTGVSAITATASQDATWFDTVGGGSKSFKLVPASSDSYMAIGGDYVGNTIQNGMRPGHTYTVSGTIHVAVVGSGTQLTAARSLGITLLTGTGTIVETNSAQAANVAGTTQRISLTFTLGAAETAAAIRFYHGYSAGTVNWDNLMLVEWPTLIAYFDGNTTGGSWSGTANLSTSFNTIPTSLTFAVSPQGQAVRLTAGGVLSQTVERTNVPAGTYTLAWSGTTLGRVYNVGGTVPTYAASPITVAIDGTANVLVEFTTPTGVTANLSQVVLDVGITPSMFRQRMITEEFALCARYYMQWSFTGSQSPRVSSTGYQTNTTGGEIPLILPVPMRVSPIPSFVSLSWTDGVNFNAALSSMAVYQNSWGPYSTVLQVAVGFAANGAALRPGVLELVASGGLLALSSEF